MEYTAGQKRLAVFLRVLKKAEFWLLVSFIAHHVRYIGKNERRCIFMEENIWWEDFLNSQETEDTIMRHIMEKLIE